MSTRKWKKSKAVLPLLLAAMMVVEPIGAMSTVYAEEMMPLTELGNLAQNEEAAQTPADGVEEEKQETDDGAGSNLNQGADVQDTQENDGDTEKKEEDEGTEPDNADENAEPSEEPTETEEPSETEDDEKPVENEGEEPEEEIKDEPEEDSVSENNLEERETVSENDLENGETEKAADGFKGMPASYKLSAEQIKGKSLLAAHTNEIRGYVEGTDYVKGQVLTEAGSQEEAEMIAEAYNAEIVRFEYGILTLQLKEGVKVEQAVRIASDPDFNIPAVWPNYYRHLTEGEPDGIEIETEEYDIDAIQQELELSEETSYRAALEYTDVYLQPNSDYYQWHHTVIGSPYAWNEGYTGKDIKVAVLDSGVYAQHNDLPTVNNINASGSTDSQGHGTHVAGIIAARANGSMGVGVAPEVTLYSGNLGSITSQEILTTLEATKGKGIHLVNMSIGGLGYSGLEQDAVDALYNEGTAIFASAGNDGGQTYSYPACYDHVISVAATDKNNERASFSNYSDKVDLSAPGVAIWSAEAGNANGYVAMDGTSMACPVAVGEAAVILSGNKGLREMTGGKRVDELEKLMKKNAVKAGSGMGAGVTSLTKVFGLSTAAVKPAAPKIEITPDNTTAAQKVTVKITAQGGTTIYFTRNGKNPTFKNGEPNTQAGTEVYTGVYSDSKPLEISGQAKATIKAIAVNESGVASAVKSASYTLKPYVTKITISGPQKVVPKKSIQLSAAVEPAYATNKKVTWELYTANSDGTRGEKVAATAAVKIATNGKVTATKDATAGKYIVVATAKDQGAAASDGYPIEVITGSIFKEVKFYDAENKALSKITVTLPTEKSYDLAKNLKPVLLNEGTWTAADFKWSSNKKDIADVNSAGVVEPKKAGKATITALADDSSGKKASVTVTVVQLAEKISISGPQKLAPSKSAAFKAEVTPTTTSNKKVVWEIYDSENRKLDPKAKDKADADYAKSIGVSINASNGKVSATKKAKAGVYTVKAITKDSVDKDAKTENTATIAVTEGIINKISFVQNTDKNVKLFRKKNKYDSKNEAVIKVKVTGTQGAALGAYTVSNSNKGIAAWVDTSSEAEKLTGDITLKITATGKAAGTTKITIASTDGSNKKLVCTVKVVNPVSAITVAPPAGMGGAVAQGKTLQLKARAETEYGVITNKNVTWEMYTAHYELKGSNTVIVRDAKMDAATASARGIKIASNGKIKAEKNALASVEYPYIDANGGQQTSSVPAPYIVRATAKDDSGTYGEYTVTVGKCGNIIRLIWPEDYDDHNIPIVDWQKGEVWHPSIKYRMDAGYWGFGILGNTGQGGFTVSSSNPKVASVSYVGEARNAGYILIQAYKKGVVTFTIKAQDGSGTQVKYSVKFE